MVFENMKNEKKSRLLYILGISLLIPAFLLIFQKIQTVITQGLESSGKIRIADSGTAACEIQTQSETHFSGCNNVL